VNFIGSAQASIGKAVGGLVYGVRSATDPFGARNVVAHDLIGDSCRVLKHPSSRDN